MIETRSAPAQNEPERAGPAGPQTDGARGGLPLIERRARPRSRREVYIDAFRGLVALVMVQGHLFDRLLTEETRADPWYQLQVVFHGSTAPGFLFASGFVAGLPRAPLSVRGSLRRARRLLFILGVGYALHLPYLSLWKTLATATAAQKAQLFACDALQVIALTQLFVLGLQWVAGRRWLAAAGILAVLILVVGPAVWATGFSARLHPGLGAYLDVTRGSNFPIFPFSAFVLAGTVAGAGIGRQEEGKRRRRELVWGTGLIALGLILAALLHGRVDFWGVSPAYALVRIGGLLLLLRLVEKAARGGRFGSRALALLGHETLLVYVLHLYLLYGAVVGGLAPLEAWAGRLGFTAAFLGLGTMILFLLAAAWVWHRVKMKFPHFASLVLAFLTTALLYAFLTNPW